MKLLVMNVAAQIDGRFFVPRKMRNTDPTWIAVLSASAAESQEPREPLIRWSSLRFISAGVFQGSTPYYIGRALACLRCLAPRVLETLPRLGHHSPGRLKS